MFDAHFSWRWWSSEDNPKAPPLNRALLTRIWAYARPYAGQVAGLLITIGLVTLIGLIPPLLYRQLIDVALPQRDAAQLNLLALGMVAIPLVTGLIGVVQRYLSASVGEGLIFDLRVALYQHMQRMSLRFFTHTKTGEIMARLNNDVVGAQRAVTGTLVALVSNIIAVVFTLTIMLALEWRLTLLSIVVLPLFILPAQRVSKVLRRLTRDSMNLDAKMSALMNETLSVSGALLVKIFGRERQNLDQFTGRAAAVRDIGIESAMVGRWLGLAIGLVSAIGSTLVFWLGGHLVLQGAFTIGAIVAFSSYLGQLYGPIAALASARADFASALVSFERVFEVLDLPIEIAERPDPVMLTDTAGHARGHIRFENVSFKYLEGGSAVPSPFGQSPDTPNGKPQPGVVRLTSQQRRWEPDDDAPDYIQAGGREWATRNVSFEIMPGQLAALVGPSGAGKTTLTYLLPRLYDVTEGRITIDGHDLRDISLTALAENIGMVTQETYLFHDTLRANLRYAKPTATDDELIAACKVANIWDFIQTLPDGFDTIVGERGYRLSGGEKQRIAIARVILKNPRILILDEATSSLDSQSEALIQAALKPLFTGRTSLVIAHRLSTILAADIILVIDNGQLVESGTHTELLARNGLYATLYHTQFR